MPDAGGMPGVTQAAAVWRDADRVPGIVRIAAPPTGAGGGVSAAGRGAAGTAIGRGAARVSDASVFVLRAGGAVEPGVPGQHEPGGAFESAQHGP